MHVHEEDLELYALGRLTESQVLAVESHLRECKTCEAKVADAAKGLAQLAESIRSQTAESDRRREHRISTNDSALLRVLSPLSFERLEVRILDVSKGGLKACVPKLLQAGVIVQVLLKNTVVVGEVRYCLKDGNDFHVGVQLHGISSVRAGAHGESIVPPRGNIS